MRAGLPYIWWPYVARCYATFHTVTHDDRAGSFFAHRHFGHIHQNIEPLWSIGTHTHKHHAQYTHEKRHVMQDGGKWFVEFVVAFVVRTWSTNPSGSGLDGPNSA